LQVSDVCDTYRTAIDLYFQQGIHTVCIDEQTGIQAIERIAKDLLPLPGLIARREYEYIRHGTLGLFGNLHVATGRIIAPMIRSTRNEEDFLENVDNVIATDHDAVWRLVADNLNTHCSESLVRYVANACCITDDLGQKGVRGILASQETRREFLTDTRHRIHFIYTPKHCSWLNQIEIWFGTLRRKLTGFGSFASLDDLSRKILRFIEYYNETMAQPYSWTYLGKLL
jgi:hypothetical protein